MGNAMANADVLEIRRPFLIHGILLFAAWLTYFADPVDVVWRFVRFSPDARFLERIAFSSAAAAIGSGILFGSWRTDRDYRPEGWHPKSVRLRCVAEILHGIGIATLLPVGGCVLLIAGETLRSLRYARLKSQIAGEGSCRPALAIPAFSWKRLLLSQGFVWCAFASMLIFSVLLTDRVADVLFSGTFLLALLTRPFLPPLGLSAQ
jgi:hypothetical protein